MGSRLKTIFIFFPLCNSKIHRETSGNKLKGQEIFVLSEKLHPHAFANLVRVRTRTLPAGIHFHSNEKQRMVIQGSAAWREAERL